jgi:hypothetical protein
MRAEAMVRVDGLGVPAGGWGPGVTAVDAVDQRIAAGPPGWLAAFVSCRKS